MPNEYGIRFFEQTRGLNLLLQSITDFIMVDFDKFLSSLVIYYAQINNSEVTDGPLANRSSPVVIADSAQALTNLVIYQDLIDCRR